MSARFRVGDPVEWKDAYGGTQWGVVVSVEPSGRVYVTMLSFRGRARASRKPPPEVFWEANEAHKLRPRPAETAAPAPEAPPTREKP